MILKEAENGHQHRRLGRTLPQVVGRQAGEVEQARRPRFVPQGHSQRPQGNRKGVMLVGGFS